MIAKDWRDRTQAHQELIIGLPDYLHPKVEVRRIMYEGYAKLSEIRLAGKWLEACGFEVGRFIHVRPLNNTIVITLLDEPPPDEKPKT